MSPMDAPGASLKVVGVTKRFGSFTAIEDISLTVEPGEFVTFLGPSGSGKTTTLNCIAGFEAVTHGEVYLGDQELTSVPVHKRNLGMVFQGYALFPHMNVEKNVAYPLKQRRIPKEQRDREVSLALETVGLTEFRDRLPSQLSGGQRQRVALARAICFRPPLLLMDEPLSALDKSLREQLQQEIRRIHRELGTTVVFVTHDQDEALALSDRVVVFNHGRIVQVGTPRELYREPATPFVCGFVGESLTLFGNYEDGTFTSDDGTVLQVDRADLHQWSGPAQMMIRPENVDIATPGSNTTTDPSDVGTPQRDRHAVDGVLEDVTYIGNAVKYRVQLAEGAGVARSNDSGPSVGAVGDEVRLSWAAEHAWVLRTEEGEATAAHA